MCDCQIGEAEVIRGKSFLFNGLPECNGVVLTNSSYSTHWNDLEIQEMARSICAKRTIRDNLLELDIGENGARLSACYGECVHISHKVTKCARRYKKYPRAIYFDWWQGV